METYLLVLIILIIIFFLADQVRGFVSSSNVMVAGAQPKVDIKTQMDIQYQMSRLESKLITYPRSVEKGYKTANGAAFVLLNIPFMLNDNDFVVILGNFNNLNDVIESASKNKCLLFTWGGIDKNNKILSSIAYGFNRTRLLNYISVVPNDNAVSGYSR
jgi:hypothetical protein